MSTGITLEELHRFFEDDPDDYQLEMHAETRLKALYNFLMNSNSRTMLQIGLTGLLTYVKASQRSSIIDDLLLSKDYISEIITMAADHFLTAPLLSATCLYECMLHYPKKFSPFLINKFRPYLPRIIFKKLSGPNEICCKCLAQLSVLGVASSSKQVKAWKTEYEHYLKIASLLIDQLYSGVNERLCPDITDVESALATEVGDVISSNDYAAIFANCCHILRSLLYVQLDTPVSVPCERTLKLIFKVISINHQQFNLLHRKQHLAVLVEPTLQLCDALATFNPSTMMFQLRPLLTSIISLLDLVRSQVEYPSLSMRIYAVLTNFLALFHRQVRFDVDVLQKFIRWIIHDSTMRPRSKLPTQIQSKTDHHLTPIVLNCTQQLINVYSDHMPQDQYSSLQNHFLQTLMACQLTNAVISKPYDDELCRVGLYQVLECLLLNERVDCQTILAVSKDLIDQALVIDASVKVKMVIRKLKLIWQQVHDSSSHLYQPWSFLNVDKPRKTTSNPTTSNMATSELHHIFAPTPPVPMMNSYMPSMMDTDQSPALLHPPTLSKPSMYQAPIETVNNSAMNYLPVEMTPPIPLTSSTTATVEAFIPPLNNEKKNEYDHEADERQQHRKRTKLIDTRPMKIDDNDDDDGAEQIFADDDDDEDDEELIEEEDDEEIDESDEVTDDDQMEDEHESDISSSDDGRARIRSNGLSKITHHLGAHKSNIDLLAHDPSAADDYLQTMNDNLHKKFRRHNHQYPIIHSATSEDYPPMMHHLHSMQMNGEYKVNSNGQELAKDNAENADEDDDDDIVLVSDDDDDHSDEKKSDMRHHDIISSVPELPNVYPDKLTIKSNSATFMLHDNANGNDLIEDLDRTAVSHVIRVEASSVDDTTTSFALAIQETVESLRDAITLVSDDYDEQQ